MGGRGATDELASGAGAVDALSVDEPARVANDVEGGIQCVSNSARTIASATRSCSF